MARPFDGVRLREIRLALGLTQAEFAAALGRARGRITLYETGKAPLPEEPEFRLAIAALMAGLKPAE